MQFFKDKLAITVQESKVIGTFDVFLGDEMIYSKKETGRLPRPGEVEKILLQRIG